MIRLLMIVGLLGGLWLYWAVPRLQPSPQVWFKQRGKTLVLWAIIAVLALLAVTGRLNGLFAMLGVAVAFIARMMPVLYKYAPFLEKIWLMFQSGEGAAQAQSQASGRRAAGQPMSREEALQVLGLQAGASRDEIILAHRKLMAKNHPDKGGSDYLAAQINLAKSVLLD